MFHAPSRSSGRWRRWVVGFWVVLTGTGTLGLHGAEAAGYRAIPLAVGLSGKVGFTLMAPAQTGIGFGNQLPEARHLTNQILLNGAGVAAGDVDGDGWVDLYFCATHGTNALYRNRGGWRFERVPDAGGAGCANLTSTGAAFADLDGDGDLDLVVNTLGNGTRIFWNDGIGRFRPGSGLLNERSGGMTTAVADVDGDGFLDLYIANYRTSGLMDMPNARATFRTVDGKLEVDRVNGRPVTDPDLAERFRVGPRGEVEELGEVDRLYRNVGGTNFVLEAFEGGKFLDEEGRVLSGPLREWGLCAMFRDLNGDTRPDLYVCNDFQSPDRLWINQGDGRFRLAPRGTLQHTSRFSMAVDFSDLDRNGLDDFLVVDMRSREHGLRMRSILDTPPAEDSVRDAFACPQYGRNTLFLNRGGLRFSEIAHLAGLEASEWSWACVFLDVDLDGWEDVLISNGMERAARDQDVLEKLQAMRAARRMSDAEIFEARRMYPRLATANLAFRNRGDLTFEEVGTRWGFNNAGISHAMALADLDNDGDLDVVVNNLNSVAGVYRNESGAPRVAVRLAGLPPNTRGIGARIRVLDAAGRLQSQEMIAGGRYLGGDDPVRTFAALSLTNRMTIEVLWRSGRRSRVDSVFPNQLFVVEEPAGPPAESTVPGARHGASLFEDVSSRLQHRHLDEEFDDYQRQPLLPWKLSRAGPCVAWADLDADGDEDLVIGTGKGAVPGMFLNDGQGSFNVVASTDPVWTRETAGLVTVTRDDGRAEVWAGVSHYEDGLATGVAVRRLDLDGTADMEVPVMTNGVVGALAMSDVDGDGDLDLFVAGRVMPGRYPQAATSRLIPFEQGRLQAGKAVQFEGVGLVNGCLFTDVDGDGDPDLVLACEWGALRLWLNQSGKFVEATAAWGLSDHAGLWSGVAAGDFDGDGRLDLVAGNWGRNTKYQAHLDRPVTMHFWDHDGDGWLELIEGVYDPVMRKAVPVRQLGVLARKLPQLRERYSSHRAFGAAGLDEILAGRLSAPGGRVEFRSLESAVFLNRGDRFERLPLPVEAQMAPVFGMCVGDVDADGREDLFLAQNLFGVQPEDSRLDAGYGLWLLGEGGGKFRALSPAESGVELRGEQRGAAVADFDADGRLDLVVAQHQGATRLFRNRAGKGGVRVRLVGPPGNRAGIGAVVRLRSGTSWGPSREVHSGGGTGSQDGAILVLGSAGQPEEVEVRWPGGRRDRLTLKPGQREVKAVH